MSTVGEVIDAGLAGQDTVPPSPGRGLGSELGASPGNHLWKQHLCPEVQIPGVEPLQQLQHHLPHSSGVFVPFLGNPVCVEMGQFP